MKQAVIILSLALIAALIGVLVLVNANRTATDEVAVLANAQKGMDAQIAADQLARQQAEEQAKAAEEAARMAEAKAAQEAAERRARFQALNEQLRKEALAREAAEKEAADIAVKMQKIQDELEATRKQQADIAARQAAMGSAISDEQKAILADIERRKQELAQLTAQTELLQQQRTEIIHRQIELEEAIMKEGGTITIPGYRIWSPNYRPSSQKSREVAGE
ncbi:MAG: hypothetical protein Q7Q73_13010 [Verrucomicrobiota bacterium JB024]|nr:hypothetical protein [Verrucomicrobiota bacterium JB024]